MSQSNFDRVRALTAQLNRYRYEYYSLNAPTVSDEVYDRLFDELKTLEQELGIRMGNSPTQTVGWPAVEKLQKTIHTIPLLSMDKTKRVEDLCSFMGDRKVMLMPKLDGLTVKLTYLDGSLQEAATRTTSGASAVFPRRSLTRAGWWLPVRRLFGQTILRL